MSSLHFLHQFTLSMCFLLLVIVNLSRAQESNKNQAETEVYATLGFGYTSTTDYGGITGLLGAYYSSSFGILGVRYLVSDQLGVEPHSIVANRINGISEVSVSWGYSKKLSILNISASAGIGGLWGSTQVTGEEERFSIVSFPFEAQFMIKPVRFVGIGAILSTSINRKSTISSGMVVLQISNLY